MLRLLVITKHVPAMLTETQRLEHLSPCDLIAFKAFSNCASDNTADIVIIFVLGKENEYCKHKYHISVRLFTNHTDIF